MMRAGYRHKLIQARKRSGYRAWKVAEMAGIGVEALYKIERGDMEPRIGLARKIKAIYGYDGDDLFDMLGNDTKTETMSKTEAGGR